MPLHRLYVPPNLYTPEEKSAIAKAITGVYSGLPTFYVVVVFVDVPKQNYFVGGEQTDRFLRIVVHHVARQFASDERKRNFMDRYEAALEPWTKRKGIDWEIQVAALDHVSWNENGIRPPLGDTEAEKLWKELNRPVPYEPEKGGFKTKL
ncbi:hypothetical protein K435DRAFT_657510 [Dendrothele bispora CBS 962.96]|uniref:Tautomerase cis-CaaD-like domain-containing protein n=1 Tax=Dendrothele bispora (strain CBS 962.96) TaxID=1314807 RepID=A0A4S8MCQ4_DENBC|nr:hypothetical protein K435DRAFT_657510 [Dendrothele bispora CBS 962.96]